MFCPFFFFFPLWAQVQIVLTAVSFSHCPFFCVFQVVNPISKAMVFPVVMYGCESWTIKKAEHQRIDAFELWYWERLLRVPWIVRRSNQSIINEISPEYSSEELMLKLKLQYFGYLMWRTNSLEKTLKLGRVEGRRRRGWQRRRRLGDDREWEG